MINGLNGNFQKKFPHQQKGLDIFCGLDMMDNMDFLEKLKFSISDKSLHYYLYNWMCPSMRPDKVLITAMSSPVKTHWSHAVNSKPKVIYTISWLSDSMCFSVKLLKKSGMKLFN